MMRRAETRPTTDDEDRFIAKQLRRKTGLAREFARDFVAEAKQKFVPVKVFLKRSR